MEIGETSCYSEIDFNCLQSEQHLLRRCLKTYRNHGYNGITPKYVRYVTPFFQNLDPKKFLCFLSISCCFSRKERQKRSVLTTSPQHPREKSNQAELQRQQLRRRVDSAVRRAWSFYTGNHSHIYTLEILQFLLYPRHPVIFSDDDWGVQSPPQHSIYRFQVPLPFSGGDWIPREILHVLPQGSLNYPSWGDQTMQMYGHFEGFPPYSALFGVVI